MPVRSQRMFAERTFFFDKAKMDQIRATCTKKNVRGLSSGRWRTNDGAGRKNQKGALDLSRAGELAVYTLLRNMYAVDSSTRNWSVGPPDFSRRSQEERDKGDIPVYYGWDTFWVEVKTATNRMGRHNRKNTCKVASTLGYTFQKQIWCYKKRCRVLTATFDETSDDHAKANRRLLVGCVGTYSKCGGAHITVSSGTFLLPVSECKWARRNYYAKGDADLKMVHYDHQFMLES